MLALNMNADSSKKSPRDIKNADFASRAEELPVADDSIMHSGSDYRILESVALPVGVRKTCLLTMGRDAIETVHPQPANCEALVISGELTLTATETTNETATEATAEVTSETTHLGAGDYLRLPQVGSLQLHTKQGCCVFLKLGEMLDADQSERKTNTRDDTLWLPGPVEHTEVMPLHMHESRSVLLIRWSAPAWFKPQLDPQGEEVFVLTGKLHDARGTYEPGSWIRNPVPAWQAWGGHPGTLVYYKNGHFPDAECKT